MPLNNFSKICTEKLCKFYTKAQELASITFISLALTFFTQTELTANIANSVLQELSKIKFVTYLCMQEVNLGA